MFYPPNYPPNKHFAAIAAYAECDVRDFLRDKLFPTFEANITDWEACLREIQRRCEEQGKNFPDCNSVGEFITELLGWLESKKREDNPPEWLWVYNEALKKLEMRSESVKSFYHALKVVVADKLCSPILPAPTTRLSQIKEVFSHFIPHVMGDLSDTMQKFGIYLAENKIDPQESWDIRFQPIIKKRKDFLRNTVSFLYLSAAPSEKERGVLHIVYSPDKIREKTFNARDRVGYLEKIFLHEMGHARLNLADWYKPKLNSQNPKDRKWHLACPPEYGPGAVASPSSHEFMAWSYGFSVRSCIKSFRSWITRLFKEIDDEWVTM